MLTIHPAVEAPSLSCRPDISDEPTHHVDFHHPAYPPGEDRLLRLAALDHIGGGLHHGIALDALTIIAANAPGGYFSKTRGGPRIDATRHSVLTETHYYFIIPDPNAGPSAEPYKYPICPSFADWMFPHGKLPDDWTLRAGKRPITARKAVSGFSEKVIARDESCRASGYHSSVQACHLVPRAESDWFFRNRMDEYNQDDVMRGDYALDDSANAITLRTDLHIEFDSLAFVLAPKSPHDAYTVHCLVPTPDILPTFHNHLARAISAVAPEFLYARFAYAIFPRLSAFLAGGRSAKLTIRVKAGGTGTDQEVLDVPADEFRQSTPKPRSASPKKRTRREAEGSSVAQEGNLRDISHVFPGSPCGSKRRFIDSDEDFDEDTRPPIPFLADLFNGASESQVASGDESGDDARSSHGAPDHVPAQIWDRARWYPGVDRVLRLKKSWIIKQRPEGFVPPPRWNGDPNDTKGYFNNIMYDDRIGDFEGEPPLGPWGDEVNGGAEKTREGDSGGCMEY